MMVSAGLGLAVVVASLPLFSVQGTSDCPTPAEVAAVLPAMVPHSGGDDDVPRPYVAWIEALGPDLVIELRSLTGEQVRSRRLSSGGTCAELVNVAAVVIASWTAERNPGLSLLQPGVGPPSQPAPPRSPAASVTTTSAQDLTPAKGVSTREFDVSLGLGSSANDAGFVGATRLDAGMRGRRLGLRVGFAAETTRNEAIATGTVSWRRYGLSLGPTLAISRASVSLDARADAFLGFTRVTGSGFDLDRQSTATAPGVALALRLGMNKGGVRPWLEVGGQYWLASQEITIARQQQTSETMPLARAEARLLAGISLVLSR